MSRQKWLTGFAVLIGFVLGVIFSNWHTPIAKVQAAEVMSTDRQEILDLISRYSYVWDAKDADAWAALFKDDANWVSYRAGVLGTQLRSKAEILKWARERHQSQREQGIQTRHVQTNTLLERVSDGSVKAETMVTILGQQKDKPAAKITLTGTYRDRFEKTSSGWKFVRRELYGDQK